MSKLIELQQDNVIIPNKVLLEKKFRAMVEDGADKLLMVADFDGTLTKSYVGGKPTQHTFDIFSQTKTLSRANRDGYVALAEKYEPQFYRPELTVTQKQEILNQWFIDFEVLTVGEEITVTAIQEATDIANTPLRDGCEKMLSLLSEYQVPLVVVSAGIGEIIAHTLKGFKTNIVSNFLRIDKYGKFLGFTKPFVSVYNKHELSLPVDSNRQNVILLGDSIGDCNMADGVPNTKTVLKIGFMTGKDEKTLEKYSNCYDVVLLDDQTMHTVTAVLRYLLGISDSV